MRDANEPIFKNLSNILILLTKTVVQKTKNIFTPLWIGNRNSVDQPDY